MLKPPPKRLYKYRSFSGLTLRLVVEDTVYFADPTTFNDPLDTKPTLEIDVSNELLKTILTQLVEERTKAEMIAAAKKISYRGPKTLEHIANKSRYAATQTINEIVYSSLDPEYNLENPEALLLGVEIEQELLKRYNRGVFALAERANCPLMWSHYGDQHRGVCLGYSIPDHATKDIHKINYGGSRMISASAVLAMLSGNEHARAVVDQAVLLKKARSWAYEREWRLLGPRGEGHSPLELEEVVFGMRCPSAVIYSICKALERRETPVQFYEIRGDRGSFRLKKRAANLDELMATYPIRTTRFGDF